MGLTKLIDVEAYTVNMPASLDPNAPLTPLTFHSGSSRPSILKGMDKGTVTELVRTVSGALARDLDILSGGTS